MSQEARGKPRQQRSLETRASLLEASGRVFARLTFAEARLKDITEESGISSEGAIFFHFGKKEDVAAAVIKAQQERMLSVLNDATAGDESSLAKIVKLIDGLADLIATDPLVQGGIRLANQPSADIAELNHNPFFRWVEIARDLIEAGKVDGSIGPDVDAALAAEIINALFIGEQVLAGLSDSWASLPSRVERLRPHITNLLAGGVTSVV